MYITTAKKRAMFCLPFTLVLQTESRLQNENENFASYFLQCHFIMHMILFLTKKVCSSHYSTLFHFIPRAYNTILLQLVPASHKKQKLNDVTPSLVLWKKTRVVTQIYVYKILSAYHIVHLHSTAWLFKVFYSRFLCCMFNAGMKNLAKFKSYNNF